MHHPKNWIIAPPSPAAQPLAATLKTSPLIAQMLINRGIQTPEDGQRFLSPSLNHLHEPAAIPNLMKAAERIAAAIRNAEKIVIYGDYDVDGITATAILWHAIKLLGGQAEYYIPHRLDEGYGMNAEAIGQICDGGAKLIVSVDCGITAVAEAQLAAARGVDLIITDHHLPHAQLPVCLTIVHPRLAAGGSTVFDPEALFDHEALFEPEPQSRRQTRRELAAGGSPAAYPNPNLCGAGVAFKLAWGLGQVHGGTLRVNDSYRRFLIEATALAALGTIADVVPLIGENRALARFGLSGLKASQLTGIKALIESAGLTGQKLDSYHVGFLLAPRLNACGRMGHARLAVEMLTSADEARARDTAVYLEQQNRNRQALERQIFEQAVAQVEQLGMDKDDCRGFVLAAEGWHPGVIGIVASRIVGRFHRPTVMVAMTNGHGQGSGRSIPGFHLAQALLACGEHLIGSGGHEMAAGLRLESSRIEAFRAAFREHANGVLTQEMLIPQLRLDCIAELRQITEALVADLDRLGPFGMGNPKPLLCCQNVQIAAPPRRVGRNGDHLQLLLRQNNCSMRSIAFNCGALFDRLQGGTRVDLAVEPTINDYNGRRVELEIKDVRLLP